MTTDVNSDIPSIQVKTASLIEGSETPVGEGNNAPMRCLLSLPDGSLQVAVLKRLPEDSLAIEIFCALVLRGWGLHVPQPFMVLESSGQISFGSADDGFPNLKHRLNIDDDLPTEVRHELRIRAASILAKFSQTPLAIAADEAIANRDRHLANVLWDGTDVFWIDHERALGNSLEPDQNRLVMLICLLGEFESLRDKALTVATMLPTAPQASFPTALQAYCTVGTNLSASLSTGLEMLTQKVLHRFPQPS